VCRRNVALDIEEGDTKLDDLQEVDIAANGLVVI
jgi:hypothetical protein